jgi:molybdopterin converting factor subunit 1
VLRLKVLFFGQLKDIAGRSEDSVELPEGSRVEDVFAHYASAHPRLRELAGSIVVARNQQFTPGTQSVADGDEIAFLPPVSGGSGAYTHQIESEGGHFFALTRDPIDTQALRKRLLEGTDGAIVVFEGVVRNNTKGRGTLYLDYECYEAMAIRTMADIGVEIAREFPIGRIAMVHRLGRMEIGEASVVIVATAPHRRPAFDAALQGINRLKRVVPVWKKEYFADGEVWVEGEWDSSVRQR